MLKPKTQPQPTLEERIETLRADIDAYIDKLVEEERKRQNFNQPAPSIRHSITRGIGCQCATYLEVTKKENAA
jgi:hypothetical protein